MCKGVEVGRGLADGGGRKGATVEGLAGSKGEEAARATPGCVYMAGWGVLFLLGHLADKAEPHYWYGCCCCKRRCWVDRGSCCAEQLVEL